MIAAVLDSAFGEIITTCSKLEVSFRFQSSFLPRLPSSLPFCCFSYLQWLIKHGEEYLRPESRAGNLILSHKSAKVRLSSLVFQTAAKLTTVVAPSLPTRSTTNLSEPSQPVSLGTTVSLSSSFSRMFLRRRAHASRSSPAFHNSLSQISAALFSGNSLVLKCSEQVAWSSNFFVDVVRTCLAEHGFDPEVLQVSCSRLCDSIPL